MEPREQCSFEGKKKKRSTSQQSKAGAKRGLPDHHHSGSRIIQTGLENVRDRPSQLRRLIAKQWSLEGTRLTMRHMLPRHGRPNEGTCSYHARSRVGGPLVPASSPAPARPTRAVPRRRHRSEDCLWWIWDGGLSVVSVCGGNSHESEPSFVRVGTNEPTG